MMVDRDVRVMIGRRYRQALQAVDDWAAVWLKAAAGMQLMADELDRHCVGVAVGEMAGFEPRLVVLVDSDEKEAAVCRAVEEVYGGRSVGWVDECIGGLVGAVGFGSGAGWASRCMVMRFEPHEGCGDEWRGLCGFWLCVMRVED